MGRKSILVEQYGDEAELFKLASAYYRKNGKVMAIKVLEKWSGVHSESQHLSLFEPGFCCIGMGTKIFEPEIDSSLVSNAIRVQLLTGFLLQNIVQPILNQSSFLVGQCLGKIGQLLLNSSLLFCNKAKKLCFQNNSYFFNVATF